MVVNVCKEKFRRFLQRFIDPSVEDDEKFEGMDINEPVYMQKLEEVIFTCEMMKRSRLVPQNYSRFRFYLCCLIIYVMV